jgi:hypothetical protein
VGGGGQLVEAAVQGCWSSQARNRTIAAPSRCWARAHPSISAVFFLALAERDRVRGLDHPRPGPAQPIGEGHGVLRRIDQHPGTRRPSSSRPASIAA